MFESKRRALRRWGPQDTFGHASATRMLAVETELREAIRTDQLRVYYQPTLDLNTSRIVGVEALLRWQHPERGLAVAARTDRGRREARPHWRDRQLGLADGVPTGERVARRVRRRGPVGRRQRLVTSVGRTGAHRRGASRSSPMACQPELLRIEITESQFVSVDSDAIARPRRDSRRGCGNRGRRLRHGFAGFDYLRRLPVTSLKIDKCFIDGLGHDARVISAIVAAVIALANNLGLRFDRRGNRDGRATRPAPRPGVRRTARAGSGTRRCRPTRSTS